MPNVREVIRRQYAHQAIQDSIVVTDAEVKV
jgi:hypothetical protein